ncbi:MAG: lysophospholipase L1-like esterase, partial [Bryobacterales bacterium]|nr:lysophospholipase L1-like esterase [Bryobacterales bacterium]
MRKTMMLFVALAGAALCQSDFYLKSGDRVVFYGDSITDQRLYTTDVETYVVTRFPTMPITFVH